MGFWSEIGKKGIAALTGGGAEVVLPSGGIAGAFVGGIVEVLLNSLEESIKKRGHAAPLFQRAKNYLSRGEYDRAIAELTEVIRLDPNNAWAHFHRALVYLIKATRSKPPWDHNCIEHADADMAEARRLKPHIHQINFASGFVYSAYLLASDEDFRNGQNIDRAFQDIGLVLSRLPAEAVARSCPDDRVSHRVQCLANFGEENYDRAIAESDQLLRLNPKDVSALFIRGASYLQKQELDRAITDLTEAQRVGPDSSMIREALAEAYGRRGVSKVNVYNFGNISKDDCDRAIADLNEAKRLGLRDPDPDEIINNVEFVRNSFF